MGDFAVQRIAPGMQVAQARQRVGHLQQRTMTVVAQAAKQRLRTGLEIDDKAALVEMLPVELTQDGSAARGKHPGTALGQFINDSLLGIAKRRFALVLKVVPYGAAQPPLDHRIGVGERKPQTPGELPPDGGFA